VYLVGKKLSTGDVATGKKLHNGSTLERCPSRNRKGLALFALQPNGGFSKPGQRNATLSLIFPLAIFVRDFRLFAFEENHLRNAFIGVNLGG
jgi:hypothetical protein